MDNCVAFGPLFPDEQSPSTSQTSSAVLANLYKAMEIYTYAILELTR